MANPWLSSTDLITAIKRRISFPTYQSTFTDNDLLQFANDVMKEEILPNMMQYHEEFFVTNSYLPLAVNVSSYPIPNRAIGMKLRDIMYADGNASPNRPLGQLFEMTRINADDKGWFDSDTVQNNNPFRFYIQGNNIVLLPTIGSSPRGYLVFYWFMRPNQLVEETRAFVISAFSKTCVVTNSSVVAGDTVTLSVESAGVLTPTVFTAVAAAPTGNQFLIGATSSNTASNLVTAINAANLGFTANNGNPATNTATISYTNRNNTVASSNSAGFLVQTTLGMNSASSVPSNITVGGYVDLLQTLPGHKTLNYDAIVPTGGAAGMTISLNESDVPDNIIIGDYICSRNECIIPQIPPELQTNLVQRICSRILEAIGDKEGMAVADSKIEKLDKTGATLIDDRVEGAPQKILNRHSLLRYNSLTNRRRW